MCADYRSFRVHPLNKRGAKDLANKPYDKQELDNWISTLQDGRGYRSSTIQPLLQLADQYMDNLISGLRSPQITKKQFIQLFVKVKFELSKSRAGELYMGSKQIDTWYRQYTTHIKSIVPEQSDLTFTQQRAAQPELQPEDLLPIGFKSIRKRNALADHWGIHPSSLTRIPEVVDSFPTKDIRKMYTPHHIYCRGTLIIDILFAKPSPYAYLFAIEGNTRYLWVVCLNPNGQTLDDGTKVVDSVGVKSGEILANALRTIIDAMNTASIALYQRMLGGSQNHDLNKMGYIIGDGEAGFDSKSMKEMLGQIFQVKSGLIPKIVPGAFYEKHCKFLKDTDHRTLSLVNRVMRTIRDMNYVMVGSKNNIEPNVMNMLVDQYNYAPHKSLSKYACFDISPRQVLLDPDLEQYVVMMIRALNADIVLQKGFYLKVGDKVKVFDDLKNVDPRFAKRRAKVYPEYFTVIGVHRKGYKYKVVGNRSHQELIIPRYRLTKVN
jgi:hypothetical protein